MAIYHLDSGFISRSAGRSVVQAVAYVAGEKLLEERRNLVANFTNRAYDVEHSETVMSDEQLAAFQKMYGENFRPIDVWNILENFEDGYAEHFYKNEEAKVKFMNSAQTAQTIVVAIPKELSKDNAVELLRNFANERFVARGLMVHIAMHQDEGNPHGHFIISRRAVSDQGEISWKKDRDIVSRTDLKITRKLWADLTNQMLEKEGHTVRITEKSYADLGLDLEPLRHRGWYADKLEQQGLQSYLGGENQRIFAANKAKIMAKPELVLEELTATQATFTQTDIYRVLGRRLGDDVRAIAQVFEGALSKALVVGEGTDGLIRYTSEKYREIEERALEKLASLKEGAFSVGVDSRKVEDLLEGQYNFFNAEQKDAVRAITKTYLSGSAKVSDQFNVLIGRAGAGKTTTLKAVSELYQNSGAQVVGTALSAMAAENLSQDAGIEARTIDSYLLIWQKYSHAQEKFLSWTDIKEQGLLKQQQWYKDLQNLEKYQLTDKHVLLIDEAGMIGSEKWGQLLGFAESAGAKVIAVGDDHQFKAIQAGDMFRRVAEDSKACVLNEIRRQSEPWMREASKDFAELRLMAGLSKYDQHDKLRGVDHDHFTTRVARHYLDQAGKSEGEGLILAYEHKTCHQINDAVRDLLKERGVLPAEDQLTINSRSYSVGDKIVCLKNQKIGDDQLRNGLRGTILSLKGGAIRMQDNEGKIHTFDTKMYDAINHGYAVTTHKSQGQTLDFTVVAASQKMDAQALYVAMTRHKNDTTLFYDTKDFRDFKDLARKLSRFDHKDLVSDYTILPENKIYHARVQSYKDLTLDLASCSRSISRGEKGESWPNKWEDYNSIKAERTTVGREILADFDRHQLYISQANLTKEGMEVECGLRARPLSQAEKLAKETLHKYVDISQKTRAFTKIMQNPKARSLITDEVKGSYQKYRDQRFALAEVIANNTPLYRGLIRDSYRETGVTLQAIQSVFSYGRHAVASGHGQEREGEAYEPSSSVMVNTRHRFDHKYDYKNDVDHIKEKLSERVGELAQQLIGDPSKRGSRELRFGSKGAISVQAYGPKQGLYCNFETGIKGGPLTLIEEQLRLDYKDAFKWAVEWLGLADGAPAGARQYQKTLQQDSQQDLTKSSIQLRLPQAWTPIFPAPEKVPDLKTDQYLSYMLKGREEVARYTYRDKDGNALGHVIRLVDKQGHKITPTLTYCENEKGFKTWKWQALGLADGSRPLYGLDHLASKPQSPVLIVEGEKTADAARTIFPEHIVLTWSGGCGAVTKTDWSPLNDHSNKDITIWPDHDQAGVKAANQVAKELIRQPNIKRSHVKVVDLSPEIFSKHLPNKWDLADALPKGLKKEVIHHLIETAPKMGQVYLTNQFEPHIIKSRIHGFDLENRIGKPTQDCHKQVEIMYNLVRSLRPDERKDVVNLKHYDQAIYMVLKLSQPTYAMHFEQDREELIPKIAMEGQVHGVLPEATQEIAEGVAERRLEKWISMPSEDRFLKCIDQTLQGSCDKETLEKIYKLSESINRQSFLQQKLDFVQQDIHGKMLALNMQNRVEDTSINETLINKIFKALSQFDDVKQDKTTPDHTERLVQSIYMAAQIQNHPESLANKDIKDSFIHKIGLEGQILAKGYTIEQSELAKSSAQHMQKYKDVTQNYSQDSAERIMSVRCLHGTRDVGIQIENIKKIKTDLYRIADHALAQHYQKQYEMNKDKSHGPDMSM